MASRVVDVLMDRSRVIREGQGKRRLIFPRIFSEGRFPVPTSLLARQPDLDESNCFASIQMQGPDVRSISESYRPNGCCRRRRSIFSCCFPKGEMAYSC